MEPNRHLRVAVLGAGGLGQAAVRMLATKSEMTLVAIADSKGFAFDARGLDADAVIHASETSGTVAATPRVGFLSNDAIGDVIARSGSIDGVFLALPNLPNEFIPNVVERFAKQGYRGVMVDALKRTRAVELLMKLDNLLKHAEITYVVGAGATPGLLTAAANLAAQSYAEIESVEVVFGVGISNWEGYRATIREDIAHLPGFDIERASLMPDAEVAAELDRRNGVLELVDMEHADDIILELAGVVERDRVTVGGIVDTRNPKKPISTNVRITGVTFEGKRSSHVFTLGDETSMAANVCGPVFGYMKAGAWLHGLSAYGILSSANVMPQFVR
ncbi:saccharopine dehydrogenase-like oxidoreductase [Candidatus Poribacteria bacterium]|nr:saccharopine dehydrogenase-like oxidoreductase [Candidatus Poribacteria bacterium]